MLHQIRRCSAPCTGLIGLDDYAALVDEAEAFLRGRSRAVLRRMSDEMQAASDDLEFERAARLRDRIRALSSVAQETQINPETVDEADVFALHAEGGQACVQVFFFRAGQNWGNRAYFPRVDTADTDAAILVAVIGQIYVAEKVKDYIVDVVFATREPQKHGLKDLAPLIEFGASPRASIALNLAARAHAFLRHRGYVTPEDVKAVGPDVLRHRVVLTYEADAEEVTSEQVVRRVFEVVEVP